MNTIDHDDYTVDYKAGDKVVFEGVLRLESPKSYEDLFAPIREGIIERGQTFTVDLAGVSFLNSSGITALARLIIVARNKRVPITIIGKEEIPWQKKSIGSLTRLWEKVTVQLS